MNPMGPSSVVALALLIGSAPSWARQESAETSANGVASAEDASTGASPPGDGTPALPASVGEAAASDLLDVSLSLYAWLPSLEGTSGVAGVDVEIDETFFDILGESDHVFGLMGSLDLEYKRWVFEFNGAATYAKFSGQRTEARTGPAGGGPTIDVDATIDLDTGWFEVFGGYRVLEGPLTSADDEDSRVMVDAFVGGRFTGLHVKTSVSAQERITLPNGVVLQAGESGTFDQKEGWAELFIGGRVGLSLGEHWRLTLRGDVGGFGIGDSEFSWQGVAAIAYGWQIDGWRIDLFGGYRALGQDYQRGGFTWDLVTHGPILGAQCSIAF